MTQNYCVPLTSAARPIAQSALRRLNTTNAVPLLAAGEAVTTIRLDLGYASPAAFTNMFKQALGVPPNRYRRPAGTL